MNKTFDITLDLENAVQNPIFTVNTNDLRTVQLDISVVQDDRPVDLTDANVRIAILKPDRKTIFQEVDIIDAESGLCEVVLDTQAYIVPGKYTAELMIYFVGERVAVTGHFKYQSVRGILDDETVESENSYQALNKIVIDAEKHKLDAEKAAQNAKQSEDNAKVSEQNAQTHELEAKQAEDNAKNAAANAAQDALDELEVRTEQFYEQKVAELQAPIDDLSAQLAQNAQESYLRYEQTDFVELLRRYSTFDRMQIQKLDEKTAEVTVFNQKKFLKFTFATYGGDYWVQSYITAGDFTPFLQGGIVKRWGDTTRTGTWVNATETINGYTTEIGATFEVEITTENDGDGIMLVLHANTSGGLWEVTVDGGYKQLISVYSNPGTKRRTLLGAFAKGSHIVKGTFLGADPENPVDNPRGWFNTTGYDSVVSGEIFTETYTPNITFTTPSNKDFAINIAPKGSDNFELIPFHGVQTDFEAEPLKMFDDNEEIDFINMERNEYKTINSFLLKQHIYGRNTASGNTNLIEIWSNQKLNKNGILSMDGKFKTLADVEIKNSYVIMGVAKGDLFTKVVSSVGNEYKNNSSLYGQYTQLVESDYGKGYLFLSEVNKNIACAFRYNDIRRTLRQGGDGKDTDPILRTYLQHRDANILKLYSRLFDQTTIPAGFTHTYSGDYIYMYVPNAYEIFN